MSFLLERPFLQASRGNTWIVFLPIVFGLLVLYVPTLLDLFRGPWSDEEQGHGPIVFLVSVWLLYRKWPELRAESSIRPARAAGAAIVGVGLLAFVLGRSQAIIQFELGSLIPVLIGLALLLFGKGSARKIWFPIFFMLFMIPLPGVVVQALTIPLKTAVSYVSEFILYGFGYPIARSGVTLTVGPYQLLVADACAGMHTLFTLEALGLLYMNLVGHTALWRNVALAILVFPVAFCANVVRVIVLILITYHFGDAAGQGFLHGFAGIVLFMTALMFIFGLDNLLGRFAARRA